MFFSSGKHVDGQTVMDMEEEAHTRQAADVGMCGELNVQAKVNQMLLKHGRSEGLGINRDEPRACCFLHIDLIDEFCESQLHQPGHVRIWSAWHCSTSDTAGSN